MSGKFPSGESQGRLAMSADSLLQLLAVNRGRKAPPPNHTHKGAATIMGAYKGIAGGIDTMMSRFEPWHLRFGNEERVNVTDLVVTSGAQALTMAKCDWLVEIESLDQHMPGYLNADEHFV